MRVCIDNFHDSIEETNKNGNFTLKIGASPTMGFTKFTCKNDHCNKEPSLPRIVNCTEENQCVIDNEIKENASNVASIVMPNHNIPISKRACSLKIRRS